jgi:hypothetical protein
MAFRRYFLDYPSSEGNTRVTVELDVDIPLRKLLAAVVRALKRSGEVPAPVLELPLGFEPPEKAEPVAVFLQRGDHGPRDEVPASDLGCSLAELGMPSSACIYLDMQDGLATYALPDAPRAQLLRFADGGLRVVASESEANDWLSGVFGEPPVEVWEMRQRTIQTRSRRIALRLTSTGTVPSEVPVLVPADLFFPGV